MAGHAEITQKTGVAIYFCDPAYPLETREQRNHRWAEPAVPADKDLSVHSHGGVGCHLAAVEYATA